MRCVYAFAILFLAWMNGMLLAQEANAPASGFVGRWEIQFRNPSGLQHPFAIVEFEMKDGQLKGRVLATAMSMGGATMTIGQIALNGDEISFVLVGGPPLGFRGKRAGDYLEGRADPPINNEWVATRTTKDRIETPSEPEDMKAFNAALRTQEPKARIAALEKFLKDFPDSRLRDQVQYQIAASPRDPKERKASLEKFLLDFPESRFREQASFRLAMDIRDPNERRAAFEKLLKDFPDGRMQEETHYRLVETVRDPDERLAAQEKFVKDFPRSMFAEATYRSLLDSVLRKKPVDEPRALGVIEGYLDSVPAAPLQIGPRVVNRRLDAYNTVADRLMVNEVLLDKALEYVQKAIVGITEKTPPGAKSAYVTTLGQIQFKKGEYSAAEENLKKGIEAAGAEGNGEARLYLGKVYEVRGDDDAALKAYLDAAVLINNADLKSSLERAYRKKFGSLDGLHEKIDEAFRARPKLFDPGHYSRQPEASAEKIVLAELFTGSECRPCIAADLAFDGIIERFDRKTVAVLEYHLHIPGPDPMTNSDTESRAKFYGVSGTPTAMIDGSDRHVGGGLADGASRNFDIYKEKIQKRLSHNPTVKFVSLGLRPDGDVVEVSGELEASAVAAKDLQNARVRLVLAEETMHYTGGNGIHFHHFVVRRLIGSPEGIPITSTGGKTTLLETVRISELQGSLRAYLEDFEKGRPNFKWAEKLDQVNDKQLTLIAFVQNDETKEVLQSHFVK